MLFPVPGKAEKKKWKEMKLLKKLEKQRMRELAEKQAEKQEEQKEDKGDAAVTRWGGLGGKNWENLVVKSQSVLHIDREGDAQRHRSDVDQSTCINRREHDAASTA